MHWPYRLVYHTVRAFLKIFYRLHVYGLSHFRPGAAVIAANHASFFDPPVISVSCPEEVHFLAREPLFRVPVLGSIIRVLNSHPVSRDASDAHTFRVLIRLLHSGQKVILFPEGSRTLDGHLQHWKRGFRFSSTRRDARFCPSMSTAPIGRGEEGPCCPGPMAAFAASSALPSNGKSSPILRRKKRWSRSQSEHRWRSSALKKWLDDGAIGEPP